jgi:hypothetical protein
MPKTEIVKSYNLGSGWWSYTFKSLQTRHLVKVEVNENNVKSTDNRNTTFLESCDKSRKTPEEQVIDLLRVKR